MPPKFWKTWNLVLYLFSAIIRQRVRLRGLLNSSAKSWQVIKDRKIVSYKVWGPGNSLFLAEGSSELLGRFRYGWKSLDERLLANMYHRGVFCEKMCICRGSCWHFLHSVEAHFLKRVKLSLVCFWCHKSMLKTKVLTMLFERLHIKIWFWIHLGK